MMEDLGSQGIREINNVLSGLDPLRLHESRPGVWVWLVITFLSPLTANYPTIESAPSSQLRLGLLHVMMVMRSPSLITFETFVPWPSPLLAICSVVTCLVTTGATPMCRGVLTSHCYCPETRIQGMGDECGNVSLNIMVTVSPVMEECLWQSDCTVHHGREWLDLIKPGPDTNYCKLWQECADQASSPVQLSTAVKCTRRQYRKIGLKTDFISIRYRSVESTVIMDLCSFCCCPGFKWCLMSACNRLILTEVFGQFGH